MNRIRDIRVMRGLTLQALAERVGTTPTQISRLETGKRKLNQEWMEKISLALKVSPSDLITNDFFEEDNVIKSEIFDEVLADISKKEKTERFNFELYLLCVSVAQEWYTMSRNKDLFSPADCTIVSFIMHDTFLDFYERVGRTEELISAVKQYSVALFNSVCDKDESGSSGIASLRPEWKALEKILLSGVLLYPQNSETEA